MEEERARFRMRIAGTPLRQNEIAAAMGKSEAWLSKILNGPKPIPPDFEEQLEAGISAAAIKRAGSLIEASQPRDTQPSPDREPTAAAR